MPDGSVPFWEWVWRGRLGGLAIFILGIFSFWNSLGLMGNAVPIWELFRFGNPSPIGGEPFRFGKIPILGKFGNLGNYLYVSPTYLP